MVIVTGRKNVGKVMVKTVPLSKLKYLSPVASQIKRKLGKGYGVVSLMGAEKGGFKKTGIETSIYSKDSKDIVGIRKKRDLRLSDALVVVCRLPASKTMYVKVNSQLGQVRYKKEVVGNAQRAIEESLNSRGIEFSKDDHGSYVVYKTGAILERDRKMAEAERKWGVPYFR